MSRENNNRTKWLHLRLTIQEYEKLHQGLRNTTCRKLSEYARKGLMGKPIIATYRNLSLDDFMAEMIRLRGELNSIGNNFNQAVKRLHTLDQIAEFKGWLITFNEDKKNLFDKMEEIEKHIQKIAESWLQ